MLFAVAEVVFQMVAPLFENVVVLIFDFPPRSGGSDQTAHIVGADLPVGDEGVLIEQLALAVSDAQFTPVDLQSIIAIGQRHVIGPATLMMLPAVALAFEAQLQPMQRLARSEERRVGKE